MINRLVFYFCCVLFERLSAPFHSAQSRQTGELGGAKPAGHYKPVASLAQAQYIVLLDSITIVNGWVCFYVRNYIGSSF